MKISYLFYRQKIGGGRMKWLFTDRARKVLAFARGEAKRLNHNYISTEHLLLGLVKEGEGVAVHVLHNFGLSPEDIRQEACKLIKPEPDTLVSANPPFTAGAEKVIELAMEEAKNMGYNHVGTEHLLLGLLRTGSSAGEVLSNLGLSYNKTGSVREEIKKLIVTAASYSAEKGSVPEAGKILEGGRDLIKLLNDLRDALNKQIAETNEITQNLKEHFANLNGKNREQSEITRIRNLAKDALGHFELHQQLTTEGKIAEAGKEIERLRGALNAMLLEDNNIEGIKFA